MNQHESKIVADGAQRLREAKDYSLVKRRILGEVRRRYDVEKRKASLWRRLWLEFKVRREVSAELKKAFPPAALHVVPTK